MQTGEYILRMEGICKEFPGVKALDNAKLSLKKGSACSGKIMNRGWGVKEHVYGSNQDKRIRETGQNWKEGRCDKLIRADRACGTMAAAKAKGLFRSEGKEYVMKDGDIVNFLFNV